MFINRLIFLSFSHSINFQEIGFAFFVGFLGGFFRLFMGFLLIDDNNEGLKSLYYRHTLPKYSKKSLKIKLQKILGKNSLHPRKTNKKIFFNIFWILIKNLTCFFDFIEYEKNQEKPETFFGPKKQFFFSRISQNSR